MAGYKEHHHSEPEIYLTLSGRYTKKLADLAKHYLVYSLFFTAVAHLTFATSKLGNLDPVSDRIIAIPEAAKSQQMKESVSIMSAQERIPSNGLLPLETKQFSNSSTSRSLKMYSKEEDVVFGEKYLYYTLNGDFCTGVNHYMESLTCGLGEAIYLKRTFVLDDIFCVPPEHNDGEQLLRAFRLYFDVEMIKGYTKVIFLSEFKRKREMAESQNLEVSVLHVGPVSSSRLLRKSDADIIQRDMSRKDFAFRICWHKKNLKKIRRPFGVTSGFASYLMELAWDICGELGWDFDVVHVRRGDKAKDKRHWPHLDEDTRPPKLLRTMLKKVERQRTVYLATNEKNLSVFYPLERYYKVRSLNNFSHLWGEGSKWWRAAQEISHSSPIFDGVMKGIVDYAIFKKGAVKLETFYDLTSDPKFGIP